MQRQIDSCRMGETRWQNEDGTDIHSGVKEAMLKKKIGEEPQRMRLAGEEWRSLWAKQARKREGGLGAGCLTASPPPSVSVLWLARELLPTTVSCLFVKARVIVLQNTIFSRVFLTVGRWPKLLRREDAPPRLSQGCCVLYPERQTTHIQKLTGRQLQTDLSGMTTFVKKQKSVKCEHTNKWYTRHCDVWSPPRVDAALIDWLDINILLEPQSPPSC